ncbi:MAG: hypothetical protein KGI97_00445 [Alphaproteobacteria bacterium]|nr:hypothetical protein [Alphaproteobacteria bacterium]
MLEGSPMPENGTALLNIVYAKLGKHGTANPETLAACFSVYGGLKWLEDRKKVTAIIRYAYGENPALFAPGDAKDPAKRELLMDALPGLFKPAKAASEAPRQTQPAVAHIL